MFLPISFYVHPLSKQTDLNFPNSYQFSSTTSNNSLSRTPQQSSAVADISSPLIQEDGDNKVLKLRFDVSQYTPEEIVVKTVDNKLMVRETFLMQFERFSLKNPLVLGPR